jgi:predicted secreted Zn-dependent protease
MRAQVSRLLTRRTARLLAAVLAALVLGAACSGKSPSPAPTAVITPPVEATAKLGAPPPPGGTPTALPSDRVRVVTTTRTTYYAVYGSTSDEILSYIQEHGPVDGNGARGSGLTVYKPSLSWTSNNDPRACSIASMTITVDLQVELPALDNPSRLPETLRNYWNAFAAGVAAHEQHHVDIYLQGAERIKQKMLALAPASSCAALQAQVNQTWSDEQAAIDREQEAFHRADAARIEAARAPLRAQIDANKARLDQLGAQISSLESSLDTLSAQIDSLQVLLDSLKSQFRAIEQAFPQGIPPDRYDQYQSLVARYNALIPGFNALVDQYNSTSAQHGSLVSQWNALATQTNALVEQMNWVP